MKTGTIRKVLEAPFWPEILRAETQYWRVHDDHDGTHKGRVGIYVDQMGDVYLLSDNAPALRFRTFGGGGMSERTRNALLLLACAIKMDNEDHPQRT